MSETTPPRRVLYLVTEGLSLERRQELEQAAGQSGRNRIEILPLTETNGAEALSKIFAADTVAVWGGL